MDTAPWTGPKNTVRGEGAGPEPLDVTCPEEGQPERRRGGGGRGGEGAGSVRSGGDKLPSLGVTGGFQS